MNSLTKSRCVKYKKLVFEAYSQARIDSSMAERIDETWVTSKFSAIKGDHTLSTLRRRLGSPSRGGIHSMYTATLQATVTTVTICNQTQYSSSTYMCDGQINSELTVIKSSAVHVLYTKLKIPNKYKILELYQTDFYLSN